MRGLFLGDDYANIFTGSNGYIEIADQKKASWHYFLLTGLMRL